MNRQSRGFFREVKLLYDTIMVGIDINTFIQTHRIIKSEL